MAGHFPAVRFPSARPTALSVWPHLFRGAGNDLYCVEWDVKSIPCHTIPYHTVCSLCGRSRNLGCMQDNYVQLLVSGSVQLACFYAGRGLHRVPGRFRENFWDCYTSTTGFFKNIPDARADTQPAQPLTAFAHCLLVIDRRLCISV